MDLWMSKSYKMIFHEFLETFNSVILKWEILKGIEFHKFELNLNFWLFILKDINFFDIFVESKWGVFSYLHLCFKVNGLTLKEEM